MKLSLGQMHILWEDKQSNQRTCQEMIQEAKKENSDLILFPEMTLTGFSMKTELTGETAADSPTVSFFQKQARENQIAIGFGVVFRQPEKAHNVFIIVNKKGDIIAQYSKIHPFSYGIEPQYYSGGNDLAFCQIEEFSVSPLICYDLRFPEVFQACSSKSNLILVIANWPQIRSEHWKLLLRARAVENQCYIAAVNCYGQMKKLFYSGDSAIIDPYGHCITEEKNESGVITGEIHLETVETYRKEFPLKSDRRNQLYQQLYTKYLE